MAQPYDVREVEDRWRRRWEAEGFGRLNLDEVDPDRFFYNLVEFPYPSAEGLHVGHVFRYSGADAYGRYQRMRGRQVFQPIGFDAFGIHTENYALRVDRHPRALTGQTTERFRAQLSQGGMAWDLSRAVDTSQPRYYRWTQWLLVQMFRAGLLYQTEAPVLWCPSCLTVLAREQTEAGGTTCERCGAAVGERVMLQWFLRITDYADRLMAGLDDLDWPERARRLQRQWIGRSEGREIEFGDLTVFTTRPETLPAVTFLAVPGGHPAVGQTRPHPITGAAVPVLEAPYLGQAIERLAFNVALARLMELTPAARSPEAKRVLVRLLAPLAPHLAEELWSRLGEPFSVHAAPWPHHDPVALVGTRVELVVQVNGKVVGRVDVPTGLDEAQAAEAAAPVAAGTVADRPVLRIVHVPDRLVNLVTT